PQGHGRHQLVLRRVARPRGTRGRATARARSTDQTDMVAEAFDPRAGLENKMIEDTTYSQRLEAYFRANRVPYQVQFHRWADSAKAVAAVEHVPEKNLAKVVMVVADEEMTIMVVPATHRLDLPFVAAALGDDYIRLAHKKEFGA